MDEFFRLLVVERHKGYFYFFSPLQTMMKQQTPWIPWYTWARLSLSRIAKSLGMHIFNFIIYRQTALQSVLIYTPTSRVWEFSFLMSLAIVGVDRFLNACQTVWCEMVLHSCLICISFLSSEDNHPFISSSALLNRLLPSFAHF